MKTIKLTQGKVALVDDEDYDFLMQWKWHITMGGSRKTYYACRAKRIPRLMHNVLLNPPKGMQVDHKDRDGLNCQRSNLRICTHGENQMNKGVWAKSGYKGVTIYAHIGGGGNKKALGTFTTAEAAARAYDKEAKKLYGEFALLNFPENQVSDRIPD